MAFINGTIRSQVEMAALNCKWMQKKENIGKKENMTAEERRLEMYKQQAYDIREGKKKYELSAKLENGSNLTPDEIDYLRKTNPQALREYEESRREVAGYEKQLDDCETKEEVEDLHMNKLNGYLSQAKDISNNPYIPKGKKLEMLAKLVKKTGEIEKAHAAFTASLKYQSLPEDEKEKEEQTEGSAEQERKSKHEPELLPGGDAGMTIGEDTLRRLMELRNGVQGQKGGAEAAVREPGGEEDQKEAGAAETVARPGGEEEQRASEAAGTVALSGGEEEQRASEAAEAVSAVREGEVPKTVTAMEVENADGGKPQNAAGAAVIDIYL